MAQELTFNGVFIYTRENDLPKKSGILYVFLGEAIFNPAKIELKTLKRICYCENIQNEANSFLNTLPSEQEKQQIAFGYTLGDKSSLEQFILAANIVYRPEDYKASFQDEYKVKFGDKSLEVCLKFDYSQHGAIKPVSVTLGREIPELWVLKQADFIPQLAHL